MSQALWCSQLCYPTAGMVAPVLSLSWVVDAILIDCLELSCDVIDFALEAAVAVKVLSDIASAERCQELS